MLLTAEAIFAAADLPTADVDVPEWGGAVRVRTLSGLEWDEFKAGWFDAEGGQVKDKRQNLTARLVALACVGEDGKPLFTAADAERLGRKSIAALTRVCAAAEKLAGVRPADREALAKNSPPAGG